MSQQVDRDRERRLPRLGDDAVVRTFDAPEALGIRFHEVRAKSALNAVPKSSRMPFRWTVNPYRGCQPCVPILCGCSYTYLMADGRTKPIADVRVGDKVYGADSPRSATAATWRLGCSRIGRASSARIGITLEDGTRTRCERRSPVPECTAGMEVRHRVRAGALCAAPTSQRTTSCWESDSSRRHRRTRPTTGVGYLCGLIRGDGYIGVSLSQRKDRTYRVMDHFRLALADTEALRTGSRLSGRLRSPDT